MRKNQVVFLLFVIDAVVSFQSKVYLLKKTAVKKSFVFNQIREDHFVRKSSSFLIFKVRNSFNENLKVFLVCKFMSRCRTSKGNVHRHIDWLFSSFIRIKALTCSR